MSFEPERGDPVDFGERSPRLRISVVGETALEGGENVGFALALDRHDEGKAEAGAIGVVELGELAQFLRREPVEPSARLLARRSQASASWRARACPPDPDELGSARASHPPSPSPLRRRAPSQGRRRCRTRRQACIVGRRRDPRRMLVNAAEALDEQRAREPRGLPAARRRVFRIQWRAMSSLVGIQTRSWLRRSR